MKNVLNRVVGFRSCTKWKMVVALIYYAYCVYTLPVKGIVTFAILVAIPFIFFAIKDSKKVKQEPSRYIELTKRMKLTTIGAIIILLSLGMVTNASNNKKEAEVVAEQKVMAIQKAKVDAQNKIIADKKAIEDKKLADIKAIEDKKIADAQAIKDKETARLKAIEDKKIADAEAIKVAKAKKDYIINNTKTFSSGEYNVGKHISAGAYDITFKGSGNFTIYSEDGSLLTNEIGGSYGISKYRTILSEGSKLKAEGMSVNTVPAQRSLVAYINMNLYAGYWIVGQDVTSGRYIASTKGSSGNFVIYDSSGSVKTNEILGSSEYAVKETVINVEDGDIINISSLNKVNFKPTN